MASPSIHKKPPTTVSIRLRSAFLLALLAGGVAGAYFTPLRDLFTEEVVVGFISRVRVIWWAPLILIGLYAALALFALPTGPLLMGGAIFGAAYGSLVNLVGLLAGAAIGFFVARYLGRDMVRLLAGERLRKAETFLARHGFWPLVQTRFMPLPFAVVNFGSGLAGVAAGRFFTATMVGLIPSTVIHTYFIAELFVADGDARAVLMGCYAGAFIICNTVLSLLWVRKWHYRRGTSASTLRRP